MENKNYIITISYGDYTVGVGGTDKVILSHQHIFNEKKYDCVYLFAFEHFTKYPCWNLLFNGNYIGTYSDKKLKNFIWNQYKKGSQLEGIFIHHLNNINFDALNSILSFCQVPIYFYLHDYYTICPSSGLVRTDGTFCGNGFPSKEKCGCCPLSLDSIDVLKKIHNSFSLFEHRITFIAPSNVAKEIWIRDYPQYADKTKVIFHQKLIGEYSENSVKIADNEKIKIGFVGYQRPLKGWNQFKNACIVANKKSLDEEFYQFGWGDDKLSFIKQVKVDFKKDNNAMINSLRKMNIHVAIIYSMWPETYAYTYYEAMASNCFIITSPKSGNVCSQIVNNKNGLITDNLEKVLSDEEKLRKLINDYRTSNHITPYELIENEEFINLLMKNSWIPEKVGISFDISFLFTVLKKFKNFLKKLRSC
ncbi:glycosyltransferase [Longibaculum muris]|uniref:glycosyltransferase n=1 Tax=Longibaculum muris TaxID=1796628 RepID=UPI00189E4CD3|nr:glycosyltransferase [Longibaculum muris]